MGHGNRWVNLRTAQAEALSLGAGLALTAFWYYLGLTSLHAFAVAVQ